MDKERKKRLRTWKIILTDVIIVILVATVAVVLSFVAMGYKFGDGGKLDQSGLLQAESTPTGATVIIDGESMFLRTNMNHLLPEGNHQVRLEREGYTSWENTLAIKSGRLYKLNYPRLFKLDREVKTVKDFADQTLKFFLISPDRKSILYQIADSPNWSLMQIDKDIPEIIEFAPSGAGDLMKIIWSPSGDRLLTKWNNNGVVEYWLIDPTKPDQTLDINKEVGLSFTELRFLNNAELLGLESGNLRKISISDRTVSRVLLSDVTNFYNDEQKIVYVSNKTEALDKTENPDKSEPSSDDATSSEEAGTHSVGFYQDETKSKIVKKSKADNILVATTEYLDERYIAISENDELEIFKNKKDKDEKITVGKTKLDFVPDEASARIGRLIVFSKKADDGTRLAIFDAERGEIFTFKLESREFSWVDDYLIGNVVMDESAPDANVAGYTKLYVRDFDGTNKRGLASRVKQGYGAVITRSNKWLYYLSTSDSGSPELKREEL